MKITNRILVLLLIAIMVSNTVVPAFAVAVPSEATGKAGQMITVNFEYKNIAGINGTITYSKPQLFSDIKISTTGLTSGSYNSANGEISYFGFAPVDCTITLFLTVAESAKIGDTCTVTLKYETTTDGNLPSVPQYKYDTVTITVKEIVDYSALFMLITKAELLDINDYTATSWIFLELALENAKNNLTAQTQAEVDKAYNRLKTAMDALANNPIYDYEKLKKQIIIAESLTEKEYTASSWSNLEKALKNARSALNVSNQDVIDNAAQTLENAIASLKKVSTAPSVDYAALKKQIKIAGDLKQKDYTPESWSLLEDALDDANVALTSTNQTFVDKAAQALKTAIANLVIINVDPEVYYGELNRQIAIAESLVKTEYTPETWAVLESALNNAKNARSSNEQSVVDSAATALSNAIASLEKQLYNVDYTELNKQIAIAEGLEKKQYTFDSWMKMQRFFDAAMKETLSIDQNSVDLAAQALKTAIAELVKMNYQALVSAIEAVKGHANSEELSEYWYEMHELLTKAQELLESGDQAAVDVCAKELEDLLAKIIDHLAKLKETQTVIVEKPVPSDPTGDYCNVESHRVWPILFWISLAVNVALALLIVVYYINVKKKNNDNTPLVDYDIGDDV